MHSHKKVLSIGFTWVKWVLAFLKHCLIKIFFTLFDFFVIRYFMDLYPIQKIKAGDLNPTYWHPMLNDDLSSAIWFSQLRDKGSLFNTYIKGHSRVKISNVFFFEGTSRMLTCSKYCRVSFHIGGIFEFCKILELVKINKHKHFLNK